MIVRIFHKAITQNFIHFNGQKVKWEPVGASDGVRTLDDVQDAALIAELDRLADGRKKGVRRISAETRDNLKKNIRTASPVELPKLRVFNPEKLLPRQSLASSGPSAPVAANVPPAPVFTQNRKPDEPPAAAPPVIGPKEPVVPKPPAKPRTMKKSELKKLEDTTA